MGLFSKIKEGLSKTKNGIATKLDTLFSAFVKVDEEFFEELEEILITSDIGVTTASKLTDELRSKVKLERIEDPEKIRNALREIISAELDFGSPMKLSGNPSVILVIGVNGVGKTTTIGKMAAYYSTQGRKVILAAADTFRAAAIDQLKIWAERAGCHMVAHSEGSDPASVVFDAISAGKARNADIVICDTAGRLHNKKNLMDELSKIMRVIAKEAGSENVEVLLVLDATTGQNAINQAKEFKKVAGITGLVLTKLDGTAKGGAILGVKEEVGVPVRFVGVGEQIDDLQPFDAVAFAEGII